jgi:hypothetical protein
LSFQLKCTHLIPAKAPLPEEAIFNRNKAVAERQCATCKAQHKERQIAKRDRNDNRIKKRKAGERGVSSDEDPSPEPSWSGDTPNAGGLERDVGVVLVIPHRTTQVSSSWRPQTAARDKNVGSSSRQAARPAREDQQTIHRRMAPSRTGASEAQRAASRQADPRGGWRSDRLPSANFLMALTDPTRIPCKGVGRGRSRRPQRQRRACHN